MKIAIIVGGGPRGGSSPQPRARYNLYVPTYNLPTQLLHCTVITSIHRQIHTVCTPYIAKNIIIAWTGKC